MRGAVLTVVGAIVLAAAWVTTLTVGASRVTDGHDVTDPLTDISTTVGAPWWMVILGLVGGPIVGVCGTVATLWFTHRDNAVSNEQRMIDQLQEQVDSQGAEISLLRAEMVSVREEYRRLQVREIAWISHTQVMATGMADAGLAIPPLPDELRGTPHNGNGD